MKLSSIYGSVVFGFVVLIGLSGVARIVSAQTPSIQDDKKESQVATTMVSDQVPSSDVNSPVPIDVRQIVAGRLGNSDETNKYHYWLVNLPPGKYKAVLDIRRADDQDSNIGGRLEWFTPDGQKLDGLMGVNEGGYRFRNITYFSPKSQKLILRYANSFTISDYWLGLFHADDPIPAPFFVHRPKADSIALDTPVTAQLDGGIPTQNDAYYLMKLPAGDYKASLECERTDGQNSNVGGQLRVLSAEGVFQLGLIGINDGGVSAKRAAKLSLADPTTVMFRVNAGFTRERMTLTVAKWPQEPDDNNPAPVSPKKPSKDITSPMAVDIGEVVTGRLGNSDETNKYHYWLVNLPPGKYKTVLDIRRADDQDSNIGGRLEWFTPDGQKLDGMMGVNEGGYRYRNITRFVTKQKLKLILRYSNSFTISDYWLGLFRADDQIPAPFFVHRPKADSIALDTPVTAQLEGGIPTQNDAYYLMKLPAGDYKTTLECERTDGQNSNVGGRLRVLSAEGVFQLGLLGINDGGVSAKRAAKLSLAEPTTLMFRVNAGFTQERMTLTVAKWSGD